MTWQPDRRRLMQWLGLAPAAATMPCAPAVTAGAPVRVLSIRIDGEHYCDCVLGRRSFKSAGQVS